MREGRACSNREERVCNKTYYQHEDREGWSAATCSQRPPRCRVEHTAPSWATADAEIEVPLCREPRAMTLRCCNISAVTKETRCTG